MYTINHKLLLTANPFVLRTVALLLAYVALTISLAIAWTHHENSLFTQIMDDKLRIAAQSVRYLLAPDFHDRAVQPGVIGREEELRNRAAFNAYARDNELAYVYTLIDYNGTFSFTSPTVTPSEAQARESWYFYPYDNPPTEFRSVLLTRREAAFSYVDEWGAFRTVCAYETSPGGRPYLACADMAHESMDAVHNRHLLWSMGAAVLFLGMLIPGGLLIRSFYHARIRDVRDAQQQSRAHLEVLGTLIQKLPVGLALVHEDNYIALLNPAFTKLTGYAQSELISMDDWFALAHPDATDRILG